MTKEPQPHRELVRHACRGAVALALAMAGPVFAGGPVTLHLQNGDRLSGALVSESTNTVVLSNAWNATLTVPVAAIARREPPVPAPAPTVQVVAAAPAPKPAPTNTSSKVAAANPAKTPSKWRTDVTLGGDIIRGARDRDIYFSTVALTYSRPYTRYPKQFFRNRLDYRVDYATTDGVESANRMYGSNKTDFDTGERMFVYNFMGVGYDEVRKIDLQYEIGPGVGYRLLRKPSLALNVEGGLNYQVQEREMAEDIEAVQFRVAQDVTWKLHQRVTFTQKSALLMAVDAPEELQFRLESKLTFGLLQNLTLNLTALELYDTRPVAGITRNEFQLRSSLGLTF